MEPYRNYGISNILPTKLYIRKAIILHLRNYNFKFTMNIVLVSQNEHYKLVIHFRLAIVNN